MNNSTTTPASKLIGCRVRLVYTNDEYTHLEPGAEGTINFIDDTGTVFVKWDDGSTLGLLPHIDRFELIEK